jgi:LysM repeat protein
LDSMGRYAMNKYSMVGLMLLVVGLLALPVFAQTPAPAGTCGFQYVVVSGDTLVGIAEKCNLTLEEIRQFNPGVGSRLAIGDILYLPASPLRPQLTISTQPTSRGLVVTAQVAGYPSNTDVLIGVGEAGTTPLESAMVRTNAQGQAGTTLTASVNLLTGTRLFVTARTADGAVITTSTAFDAVRGLPTPIPSPTPRPTTAPVLGVGGASTGVNATAQDLIALDFDLLPPFAEPSGVDVDGGTLFDRVNVYLVEVGGTAEEGIPFGCGDALVPVQVTVEETQAPLTAGVTVLLENPADELGLVTLQNPLEATELTLDRVEIINGLATIALEGEFASGGTCADARLFAQLEATARQFNTVDRVTITLNGQLLTDALAAVG